MTPIPSSQLTDQFISVAQRTTATVETIEKSADQLTQALLRATSGAGLITLAEPDDLDPLLFQPFSKTANVVTQPKEQQLATADFGVSDAFAGVARTGSVCVSLTPKLGGSVSLFARAHVAVLAAETIVARPRDLFLNDGLRDKAMHRNFVFVSGPSATADMGPLVRGVHGPGKLHIIILGQA